ncbi:hypothetical protein AOLI_G00135450 [Acnodon oligacanthus]
MLQQPALHLHELRACKRKRKGLEEKTGAEPGTVSEGNCRMTRPLSRRSAASLSTRVTPTLTHHGAAEATGLLRRMLSLVFEVCDRAIEGRGREKQAKALTAKASEVKGLTPVTQR